MIYSIIIITDDIVFPNYFTGLLNWEVKPVNIVACDSFNDIDDKLAILDYRLIILDGALSRFSSIEIIHYLRFVKHTTVPIWFFPEVRQEEYVHKSIETGATRVIMKPFDPYVVCEEIQILIEDEMLSVDNFVISK